MTAILGTLLIAVGLTAAGPDGQDPSVREVCDPSASGPRCVVGAYRLQAGEDRPAVDGQIDEAVWTKAGVASGFYQAEPLPGAPASEDTEARIVFDDDALYVAMRMIDRDPSAIRAPFVRRDDTKAVSDWVYVSLDSDRDRRTAFRFGTTPTGTRVDARLIEDTKEDVSWDAVWEVATSVNEDGWTAEFRIPLSQLRFGNSPDARWGVNFTRVIARRAETSHWAPIPPGAGRVVSLFGDLSGMVGLASPRQLEVLPYTVARLTREDVDPNDPFRSANDVWGSVGLDLKYGVTSNLTITASLNPDFGQVDADPSQVNLGTNETFYPEKRPFFLEGAEIFSFRLLPEGHALYSRRIGRPPQLRAQAPSGGFVDAPPASRILGALKLSGKTGSGWSVGVLSAVTAREEATTAAADGTRAASPVEPRTSYSSARVARDFRSGASGVGLIGTSVLRNLDDPAFDRLHRRAFMVGADGWHRFGGNRYQFRGSLMASRVEGSEEALSRTQLSNVHLFQRPDAGHLTYDPTRTTLQGVGGDFALEKIGGGQWTYGVSGWARSAGVETNDIGFLTYTDAVLGTARVRYREFEPGAVFQSWFVDLDLTAASTLGWELVRTSAMVRSQWQLLNFWTLGLTVSRWGSRLWPWTLRGGPALREDPYRSVTASVQSDSRKNWNAQFRSTYRTEEGNASRRLSVEPTLELRPSTRATVSLAPEVSWNRNLSQYVAAATRSDDGSKEYVLGRIGQTTAQLTVRVSYAFSPTLAFDLYAQPFLSSGRYSDFRRVDDPHAFAFDARLPSVGPVSVIDGGLRYQVDEDGDGTSEYSFRNRDFNVRELRSNAVVRWEYRPGSTLFLVWSSARNDGLITGDLRVGADLDRLWAAQPTNIFMVKFSHWIG